MSPRGRRITASQVGHYAYCAHAWWLHTVEGQEPTHLGAIQAGQAAHERHGWRVSLARGFRRMALVLLVLAFLALILWGSGAFR